jgi:hypothetical protein
MKKRWSQSGPLTRRAACATLSHKGRGSLPSDSYHYMHIQPIRAVLCATLLCGFGSIGQASAQEGGPLNCRLGKVSSGFILNCQIVVDYTTFQEIVFNGGSCPALSALYRANGRLTFGAVPPEIGKVFKSGDEFSLTVATRHCPEMNEASVRLDGLEFPFKLR